MKAVTLLLCLFLMSCSSSSGLFDKDKEISELNEDEDADLKCLVADLDKKKGQKQHKLCAAVPTK